MRVQIIAIGLIQAAMLMACDRVPERQARADRNRGEAYLDKAANPVPLGRMGQTTASQQEVAAEAPSAAQWSRAGALDFGSHLIVRTGQASIEVDSLQPSMTELRRIVQRVGGFVADASVQSGRNQLRSATLELKVPAGRFDDLTEALEPLGRLQFVNVGAADVSEEFVDLTARVANGHRLEERLVELLRTRTGKLQDVLSVERELARVREEIERMEGRLRYLKARAQLSTLSVALHEPPPLVSPTSGRNPLAQAVREAWRNFVGVLAAGIASLGYLVPILVLGWGVVVAGRRLSRRTA
jgi:hypothetical protein